MKHHKKNNQQGITMLLTLVLMIGMLGFIGFAIDIGHFLVAKSKFQNALDSAALSAATILNGTSNNSQVQASAAGVTTFNNFKQLPENSALANINLSAANFTYSSSVSDFTANIGNPPSLYVKVRSDGLNINNIFLQAILNNFTTQNVRAESTAGPTGQNCDLLPLVICANVDTTTGAILDKNCNNDDPSDADNYNDCYGYNLFEETEVHAKFCLPNDTVCQNLALNAGNFTLLRWTTTQGANDIRNSLSGTVNACSVGLQLETQPGNMVGPVGQGMNDRFYDDTIIDIYDLTTNPNPASPAYTDYQNAIPSGSGQIPNNRVVAFPIGDCNGLQNGNTTFDFATNINSNMAAMCALIRRPVWWQGPQSNYPGQLKNSIYIELLGLCPSPGVTSPTNPVVFGPYKIVLFKTENSKDS